jgi:hypothetical protein
MLLNTIKDRKAHQVCNLLLQEAIIQIRATAYLQKRVGWSIGDVDINDEIRRLADLCDGLAGSESGAAGRLKYRLSVGGSGFLGAIHVECSGRHPVAVVPRIRSRRRGSLASLCELKPTTTGYRNAHDRA